MGTDDLHKKRRGDRKQRKEEIKELAPYRYLIVCEGEKTEPKYFEGIKRRINEKYKDTINVKKSILKDIDMIEIKGTGRNTNDLVRYTAFLDDVERIKAQGINAYGRIWVIFDKDDFLPDQFNSAIEQAKSKEYNVGWSNEAIELWFLLHFEYLNTGINREQYIDKLSKCFKQHKINNGKYEKNAENIFEVLGEYGNVDQAIKWAKKLNKRHEEAGTQSKAEMKPATTVYELVEELKQYF